MRMTQTELYTCAEALRIAAVEYGKDAATCRASGKAHERTAEHFDLLAQRAVALADKIEEEG